MVGIERFHSLFQGVGIDCIQRLSSFQGIGIEKFHCILRCPHFRGVGSGDLGSTVIMHSMVFKLSERVGKIFLS